MADPAELALAAASVIVAAALVVVTYYLVRHTQYLARATEGLRRIEERRERADARRRQISRLKRKIELAQHVLVWNFGTWKDSYFVKGACPRPEGDEIKELATLLEHGKDHANRDFMEGLVRAMDLLLLGEKITGVPADNLVGNLEELKKVEVDMPRWEKELIALTAEETESLTEAFSDS